MKNLQSSIVIGIMCFLLSLGIAIQISSINNENTVIAKKNAENDLRNQVIDLNNDYKNKYKKLEKSQEKLEKLRNSASEKTEQSKLWSKELTEINNSLGLTNVKGNGLIIKIKTGDLLLVLNALNNAGAEAVAVNDNRITYFSKIQNDGDIVLLNGKALESPFEIKAIGNDTLYGAITMPGSYIDSLKNKASFDVSIEKSNEIFIKKYDGIYNFEFAKNIEVK